MLASRLTVLSVELSAEDLSASAAAARQESARASYRVFAQSLLPLAAPGKFVLPVATVTASVAVDGSITLTATVFHINAMDFIGGWWGCTYNDGLSGNCGLRCAADTRFHVPHSQKCLTLCCSEFSVHCAHSARKVRREWHYAATGRFGAEGNRTRIHDRNLVCRKIRSLRV